MIIGTDLIAALGFCLDFSTSTMKWEDDSEIPMKEYGLLAELTQLQEYYHMELEPPPVLKTAEERQSKF